MNGVSETPTRYAVLCFTHKRVFLTKEEYIRQLQNADSLWKCPICGLTADFDDDTYDAEDL